MQRLNVEALRGFAATRRRGTEAGGILLGQFDPDGGCVTIEGYEPVPCEYAQGPSYLLSNNDLQAFRSALDRFRPSAGTVPYGVGYWRAHTREGLALDSSDLTLFQQSFQDKRAIALVVKPYATRPSKARFFLQDASGLSLTGVPPEFPFARHGGVVLPPLESQLPVVEVPPTVAVDPPAPPRAWPSALPDLPQRTPFDSYPPSPIAANSSAVYWLALTMIGATIGALGGYEYAGGFGRSYSTAGKPGQFDPQLVVDKEGEILKISWDPRSPVTSQAKSAMLEIDDSGVRGQEVIGKRQLDQGFITYRPVGDFVKFRLEFVLNNNLTMAGNVQWSRPTLPTR